MKGIEKFLKELHNAEGRIIKVDVHEPPEMIEVLEGVAQKYDMEVQVDVLQVGDYAFRNVGIERKEDDFINVPDVLAKAEELHRAYDKAYLMTSKNLSDVIKDDEKHHGSRWNESIKGLTASLVARGVEPIFCPTKEVMCEIMCKMFDKLTDGKDRAIEQPIRPQPTRRDWQLYIISSLPNVGEVMSMKLLAHFGTVRNIFTACPEELMEVDGVGSTIANRINNVLEGEKDEGA